MRRVLVTGGAGFIGSHLVQALLAGGDAVRVLDDLSTGHRDNLAAAPGAELMVGDVRDELSLKRAVAGMTHVLHLAALPSVARSLADPLGSHEVNATGTLRLLEAARHEGVRRVIIASSSSVYGDQEGEAKVETMATRPLSPYAASKLAAESYGRVYHHVYGLDVVSLRYFNVFGPRQDPASTYAAVIPRFIDLVRRGEAPVIYGDGEQSRDFTFVANAVDANLAALAAEGVAGHALNIACGTAVSLNQLVAALGRLAGQAVEARHEGPRAGDIRHSLADLGLARKLIAYTPRVPFAEGLKITWEAMRRNPA